MPLGEHDRDTVLDQRSAELARMDLRAAKGTVARSRLLDELLRRQCRLEEQVIETGRNLAPPADALGEAEPLFELDLVICASDGNERAGIEEPDLAVRDRLELAHPTIVRRAPQDGSVVSALTRFGSAQERGEDGGPALAEEPLDHLLDLVADLIGQPIHEQPVFRSSGAVIGAEVDRCAELDEPLAR